MPLELPLRHAPRGRAGALLRRLAAPAPWSRRSWLAACRGLALLALAATASLAATVEVRPLISADDAEEAASGSMYINSSDLELVQDATTQLVGIRWPGLTIPQGATITSAWVQFVAEEAQSEVTTLTIRAQAADMAPTFTTAKFNVSTRLFGTNSVQWSPAAWTTSQAGAAQRTPELAALIQEVVNRPGWASGNAIVLVFTGTGHRTAYAQDGSPTLGALLHVEYTAGGGGPPPNLPPVASLSVTPVATPPLTVNASGAGSTDTDAMPIASYRFDFGDATPPVVTTAPVSNVNHTYAAAGTYTVTLLVTDTGGLTSNLATSSVTVTSGGGTPSIVEQRTLTSTDDAEQQSNGSVYTPSSDLELVQDGNTQIVGMRWTNLTIPRGATITAAWVQFAARQADAGATSLAFNAQAADNAGTFVAATPNDVSLRPRTTAVVNWSPAAWAAGGAGAAERTPDLKSLVQEVVNRAGWASGNALAMIVTGTGRRTAWARDGNAALAPLLHVEYTGGGGGGPPPNAPPTAQLAVTNISSPPLSVSASGAGSTDDAGIASYRFTFGDGTPAVVTSAPTAVATHTYAAAGTYTVTLTVTDTGGLTSAPVTAQATVSSGSSGPLTVWGGYYSTHHPDSPKPKPNPWMGSSGVVFVGTPDSPSGGWDTSGIRFDNLSSSPITMTVTVDVGSKRFALWGSRTVPAGQKLILAQTGFENFDGSDLNPAGCYGCSPNLCITQVQSTVPVINVTIGGVTTRYFDRQQILNTKGVDAAGCPPTSGRLDESQNWIQITTTSAAEAEPASAASEQEGTVRAGRLLLAPPYPNPVKDELNLRFQTPTRGVVNLEIYDVQGRLVTTALEHELGAGEYIKVVPVRGIMAGRYFARLRTAEGVLHQSFVITH